MTNERKAEFSGMEYLTLKDIEIIFQLDQLMNSAKTFNQFVCDFWKYIAEVRRKNER